MKGENMEESIGSITENDILRLLSKHPKGMDLIAITRELKADVRDVKPLMIHLQNNQKVGSGLKKFTGKLNYFMRYYFALTSDL